MATRHVFSDDELAQLRGFPERRELKKIQYRPYLINGCLAATV